MQTAMQVGVQRTGQSVGAGPEPHPEPHIPDTWCSNDKPFRFQNRGVTQSVICSIDCIAGRELCRDEEKIF